jgi:hypothetical protein
LRWYQFSIGSFFGIAIGLAVLYGLNHDRGVRHNLIGTALFLIACAATGLACRGVAAWFKSRPRE